MASNNKCQIFLDPNDIRIVFQNPAVPFAPPQLLARVNVTSVSGVFNQKPTNAQDEEWRYPYIAMTQIMVRVRGEMTMVLELQNVTNQPTWSTGTPAGVNQAIADIQAWL